MTHAVSFCGIYKSYGKKTVLSDFCLDVKRGEILALLGVNGAGKSTAIGIATGLIRPDGGDVLLGRHSITGDRAAAQRMLGLSPQESAVAPLLTVEENLCFVAGIYGIPRDAAKSRADALIEKSGLSDVRRVRAGKLSGGYARRLSIAMATVALPDVLFLDEPTLGLDILSRRSLHGTIREMRGRVTVILTTHYLEEAEALSDRIAVLRDGRIAACGSAAELIRAAGCANFTDAFLHFAGGDDRAYAE